MTDLIYCILFIFLTAVTPTCEKTVLNWNFLSYCWFCLGGLLIKTCTFDVFYNRCRAPVTLL